MASEKNIKKSTEVLDVGSKPDSYANLVEQDVASAKNISTSDSTSSISSSGEASSNNREGHTSQEYVAEEDVQHPPTSSYNYYYPGYDGAYPDRDDQSYVRAGSGLGMQIPYNVPPLGSGTRTADLEKGSYRMGKFSSFSNRGQGLFPQNGPTNFRPNSRSLEGYNRFKPTYRFNRNGEFESSNELTRGPRANGVNSPLSSSTKKDRLIPSIRRDQYNLKDFQTNNEQAMFFVIKSYSEDDVHKSIKFNVWASTPNGNKKLDAAFHGAEMRSSEKDTRCPIFLFFSVNASGQFVGLAEMIGQVDFKKSMDFWQQDKWNGFFPVKWHIVKDIPNGQLRHVILENNENKPVTNSRDTQEIRLKQGLEMLNIFKNYSAKTSILDDFGFYEDREKSLRARRSSTALTHLGTKNFYNSQHEHLESAARKVEAASMTRAKIASADSQQSLISLTKNLTLSSYSPKKNTAGTASREVKEP